MPDEVAAFQPTVILPDDEKESEKVFLDLVKDVRIGVVAVLRKDAEAAFDRLASLSAAEEFLVTTVWAKTAKSMKGVKTVLDALPNGDKVNYEELGHRVVSVNKADKVSLALSRAESQENFSLLRAFFCAAGTDVCGF